MMGAIWYWIVAAMLVAYVVLDGFDIGAGIVQLFISESEDDRQMVLRSIGPVWDGNEVWLIAGGGTLYFAFPLLYASAFSGFYLPLMIVLWLLILRGLGIELRMHVNLLVWREFFDGCFAFSSALLAIFFGAALANVIRGVPIGDDNFFFLPLWTNWRVGPNPGILDWYTVIGGFLALVALAVHGSLYVALKVERPLHDRAVRFARLLWPALVALTVVSLVATIAIRSSTLGNYTRYPVAFVIPLGVLASLAGILIYCRSERVKQAFQCSCAYLTLMLVGAAVGLYPALLPSSTDPARDITIAKALSGRYALSVGLIWWGLGILIAIGYFVFVYRMFSGKVRVEAGEGY
ncbi:MAG: cydB [Bryobacterales bacterium]|nr:cydB [Bryobacterales bacterium]